MITDEFGREINIVEAMIALKDAKLDLEEKENLAIYLTECECISQYNELSTLEHGDTRACIAAFIANSTEERKKAEITIKSYYDCILTIDHLLSVASFFKKNKRKSEIFHSIVKEVEDEKQEIEKYIVVDTKTLHSQELQEFVHTNCEELKNLYDYSEFENCVDTTYVEEEVSDNLKCRYCKLYKLRQLIKENKNIKLIKK